MPILPGATAAPMASGCAFIAVVSARSDTKPTALPRAPARRPEQVAVVIAMIANDAWARPAATRPQARHHAFLADPGLVLKPHLHRARNPHAHRIPPAIAPSRETGTRTGTPTATPRRPEGAPGAPKRSETPPSGAAGERSRPHKPLRRPPRSSRRISQTRHRTTPSRATIRTRLHPTPHNRQLLSVEKTRRPPARTIPQTLRTLCVVAMYPIANSLTIHPDHSDPPPPDRRPPEPKPPSKDAHSVSRPSRNAPTHAKPPACASSALP